MGNEENRPDEVEVEREEANGAEAGRREITGERRPPQWLDPTVFDL